MAAQHKRTTQAFKFSTKCHWETSLGNHTALQPSYILWDGKSTCCSYHYSLLSFHYLTISLALKLPYNVYSLQKTQKPSRCRLCTFVSWPWLYLRFWLWFMRRYGQSRSEVHSQKQLPVMSTLLPFLCFDPSHFIYPSPSFAPHQVPV